MMLEILQYYTSGFWVWAGITMGIAVVGAYLCAVISEFMRK
jgi:hypothetical protein